jgi:hypothetical protein
MSPLEYFYYGLAHGLFIGIVGTHLALWLNRREARK